MQKLELHQVTSNKINQEVENDNASQEIADQKVVKLQINPTDMDKDQKPSQTNLNTDQFDEKSLLKQIQKQGQQPEQKTNQVLSTIQNGEKIEPKKEARVVHVKSQIFVVLQVMNICIGSILFGFNLSAFNTVSGVIRHFNGWKSESQWALYNGLITSAFPLGGIFGPLLVPTLLKRMHKHIKKLMIVIDIFTIAAGICQISTEKPINMIVGRFFLGVAMSMNTATIPTYIREFSPKELGGLLGSMNQMGVSMGIFIALLFGFILPSFKEIEQNPGYDDQVNWRIVLGFPIVAAFLRGFLLLTVFKQEIPRVLIEEHHEDELIHYFHHLYDDKDWPLVLKEMEAEIAKQKNIVQKIEGQEVFDPFKASYRRRWWLAMIMAAGTQATGVNALLFFSNTIYKTYDAENASNYSKIMGGALLFFNIFFALVENKYGRRTWMLLGMLIDIISLFAFLVFNQLGNFTGIFASIIVFFLGYQLSLGPVAWLYLPQITDHEGVANYSVSRWICTFSVGLATPYMIVGITPGGTFGVYGSLLCIIFIYFLFEFKETKYLSQDQVALEFCRPEQVPPEFGAKYVKLTHIQYKDYIFQYKLNLYKQKLMESGNQLKAEEDGNEKA